MPNNPDPTVHCDPAPPDQGDQPLSGSVRIHRWPQRPVQLGDRCACGERIADAFVIEALDREG